MIAAGKGVMGYEVMPVAGFLVGFAIAFGCAWAVVRIIR